MAHVPQIQVQEPDVQTGKTSVQSEKIGNAPGEVLCEGIAASANQQEQALSRCAKLGDAEVKRQLIEARFHVQQTGREIDEVLFCPLHEESEGRA